jgi:predicted phage baseplate assembly protein
MPLTEAPLTYLPAPNASGVESTLELRVNQIEWHETGSLLDSKPASRDYVIHHHGNGHQAVQFGDGKTGARLPTGNSNVVAKYRVGLGSAGNVKPNTITQLLSRPFGVKEVTNPLNATGGADPDGIDQIRANAPIAVMALDRIVSVKDHADFARNFAGIDKAVAKAIQVGGQSFVGVSIAGSGDIPISRDSDLMINLRDAFRKLGDPCQPVITEERELLRLFLNAEIKLHPDHAWQFVQPKIEQQLYEVFSFARRQLGQDLYLSEVYNTIHSVAGVAYANVTLFTTISQSSLNSPNVLQNLENGIKEQRLVAHGGHVESDLFKPAQLIYLSRKIPDSLILSEVR